MPCNKASEKTHSGWVLLLAVQIFWSCLTESAFGVVLAWDPSPDTNVVGYAVQYGTNSGSYQTRVDVANQTNATIQLPTTGTTFFFVAIAYTVDGVESLPSNEVSYSPSATSTNQTITFGALAAKTFGEAAFSLSATASSGLPVSYTSGNPSVATLAGNTVTIVGAGSAVITASQAGNSNYIAAANVTRTLTVNNAAATVTLSGLSATYDGSAKSATATTSPGGLPVTITYSGSATAPVNAGSYAVVATVNHANYTGSASGTLTIAQPSQTITFGALAAKTFGDAAFSLNATASSGLPVSYTSGNPSVATLAGNTVTIVGAGSAVITASQAGNSNYIAAANVTRTLTVTKAAATVMLSGLSATYDGTAKSATATTSPGGLPVTITYNGSATVPVNAGRYAVVAMVNHANYTGSASGTLTIAKAKRTITFAALPAKTLGDAAFPLDATASTDLPVSYTSGDPSVATIAGNTVTIVGVGSAMITASQDGDNNYLAAEEVTQTLEVSPALPGELLISQTPDGLSQQLRFSVGPDQHWQLQASADSLRWDTLCALDAVTNGWVGVFDPIIPSAPARSYRLVNTPTITPNQAVDAIPGAVLLSKTDNPLNMQVRFSVGPNRHWQLQASEDFLHWTIICELTALANGGIDIFDPVIPSRPARFYRVASASVAP